MSEDEHRQQTSYFMANISLTYKTVFPILTPSESKFLSNKLKIKKRGPGQNLPDNIYLWAHHASRIQCSILIMYAKNDSLIPAKAVESMGYKIPKPEVIGLPVGHFDV